MVRAGGGGLKLELNMPSQRICAKQKGGLINEGGVISSEYGIHIRAHVRIEDDVFLLFACASINQDCWLR